MKKFLSLLLAILMMISVAMAAPVPSPSVTTDNVGVVPSPSITTDDVVIGGDSSMTLGEIEADVTEGLFIADETEAAVAAAEAVLEAIKAVEAPVDVFTAETKEAIETELEVAAADMIMAVLPVALNVNDELAAELAKAQILTLQNVTLGEKSVFVLSLTTGEEKEEIALTEIYSNEDKTEAYAVVDLETIAKIQAADTVVVTVLTTAVAE